MYLVRDKYYRIDALTDLFNANITFISYHFIHTDYKQRIQSLIIIALFARMLIKLDQQDCRMMYRSCL